eukprot:6207010-Pleurochrysis_carterae.AAC.1
MRRIFSFIWTRERLIDSINKLLLGGIWDRFPYPSYIKDTYPDSACQSPARPIREPDKRGPATRCAAAALSRRSRGRCVWTVLCAWAVRIALS